MLSLKDQVKQAILNGLRRRAITTCSRHASTYRVMGKPYPGLVSYKWHPWAREMHDSNADMNVGQKAAQMAYTETVLDRTFFKIDIEKVDCLYVLPAQTPDASNFSAARFDAALELSPHFRELFSDVKNKGHKRAGNTNLYIRGSRSRSGLVSVPIGFLVLDEVDEMVQDNIPLAIERLSGQPQKQIWALSTPTTPNRGINLRFIQSTQEHFFFKCPRCNRQTELTFPECLVITAEEISDGRIKESHYICKECKGLLIQENKWEWLANGIWVPTAEHPDMNYRGFYVNQMYAPNVTPVELARQYLIGQTQPSEMQIFWNSKMGLPYVGEGSKISQKIIDECKGNYHNDDPPKRGFITMGVDVGSFIHYEIDSWFLPEGAMGNDINILAHAKCIHAGRVANFEELDNLMKDYQVLMCVCDANPERRKAVEFAGRFFGHVKLCFYGRDVKGKDMTIKDTNITIDRTCWMDLALGRFMSKNIELPMDISVEYQQHLQSPVRRYIKDVDGNPKGTYVNEGPDHHAHARVYAEVALPIAASLTTHSNIGKFL
jgi:hypothetical protein